MQRVPVMSANLAEVGYEDGPRTLEVLFKNGTVYQYFDVPPAVHQELMAAGSIGQYFNANIKGQYRYARV